VVSDRRVALVSGANRGIGAEIARELAADRGFLVYAGARNPDEVGADEGIEPIRLDVADQASVDAASERIESEAGRLDALVNNAGIYGDPVGAAGYDLNRAQEVLEVNTFGPWRLTQAFLPLLRASDSPRIVNVSSGAGQLSDMNGGRAAYRVSKAALNALTRTLASDERWVKVNTMCPGWVRTDMGGPAAPRSVEEGADTAVWLATLPDDGPSGGFFRNRKPIPW
jgi:NAD(P)-dependent dehydrogenase (short-subunit alcohol dehydrogenase family)